MGGGSKHTVLRRGVESDSRSGHTNSAKSLPGREKDVARMDDGGQRVENASVEQTKRPATRAGGWRV